MNVWTAIERQRTFRLLENVTDGQREDIMLFLYMAKNGTNRWIQNVKDQIEKQDSKILSLWLKELKTIVKQQKSISLAELIQKMGNEAKKVAKKGHVANHINDAAFGIDNIAGISSQLFLEKEDVKLSEKSTLINQLMDEVSRTDQLLKISL